MKANYFDLVIGGMPMITPLLEKMRFSDPYMDITVALVVKDHRRKEFAMNDNIRRMKGLNVGIRAAYSKYFQKRIEEKYPHSNLIELQSQREFFEQEGEALDALLTSAEAGAAWTLLYPDYEVVVPQPDVQIIPAGFVMANDSEHLNEFMNRWIELKKRDGTIARLYNYWILGQGAVEKKPRWSIIRNVLHWVE